MSLIGDYFPVHVRGTAISIYYFGIYIGYSLAFAIGSGIEKVLNWRWVFFLSAIVGELLEACKFSPLPFNTPPPSPPPPLLPPPGIVVVPFVLFTVKEPKRTKNTLVDTGDQQKKLPFSQRLLVLLRTFAMPGMLTLCIAGGVRNAGGYVWAYNTELFFEKSGYSPDHIKNFMSWIPLLAGSIGAVVGGVISDVLVKGRGPYMRIWVLIISQVRGRGWGRLESQCCVGCGKGGVTFEGKLRGVFAMLYNYAVYLILTVFPAPPPSQILAAPFAAGALFLPNPWCFLTLIPSNILGEMWIGVTTAIVVDLAPSKVRTAAVAIYLFNITIIGGNFNLLVEPIRSGFNKHMDYLPSYRYALLLTFPGVYAISSLLFVLAFLLMRLDLKHKMLTEHSLIVNEDSDQQDGQQDSQDDEQQDKPV